MDEIKKSRLKKTAENRNKHIDTTLKNHGLNRDKLAILLAQEARDWILDDRIFCKLDLEKIKFAAKLKKDASGNLMYKEFSKKEKKIYFKYLSKYANSKEWKRRSNYLSGTILTPDERETLLLNASKKHVVGQLYSTQHFSETDIINKIDAITKEVSKPASINKSSSTPYPITTWRPYRPLPSLADPHTRAG
jgi:hypothetical protein